MKHFDAIVVGCGAMGSSVSYNLASRGMKVLTLERFGLNHEFGSSHGRTRIIRLAYYEDERYVPILRRAFESWRELQSRSGRSLLRMTGGLMIGEPEGTLVSGVLRSARKHGLPHRVMSGREAEEVHPALSLDEGLAVVREESAGVLFPEACIESAFELAEGAGCEFHFSEPLGAWESLPEGLEVRTKDSRYLADRLVFCSGAWTQKLLGGTLPLQCERQTPFWFSSQGQTCFTPEQLPIFILEEGRGRFFYGIPDVGHGVKAAESHHGRLVEPEDVDRTVTERDFAPVKDFIARRLPRLGRVPIASTSCLYTNTPDMNFIVGSLPGDARVLIVSACSGHGFKFASVMGELVADIATGTRPQYDLSFLSPERFVSRRVSRSDPDA